MCAASIHIQRRIEWADTDASGYHHNTAAFRMMEMAETAMFDHLGLLDEVYGRLPRVHIEADFRTALRHRDLVDIRLWVSGVGRSSIRYGIRMEREGEVAVEGMVVAVLLDESRRPTEWPPDVRERLLSAGPQPEELLVTQ
jgi:YbgC/YbaW family acyl-CoA thioester hydrolase